MDEAKSSTESPTHPVRVLAAATSSAGLVESQCGDPHEILDIVRDEIHVWIANLDELSATPRPPLAETLSAAEHGRATRFQFDRDRDRFIVRRGLLRTILARYLRADAAHISFTSEPRGKLVLAETGGGRTLHFNVSHSHGLALFAVATETPIGVDVERVRPMPDTDRIASQFFSDGENAALTAVSPERRLEAFFNAWTRKEAYLKATGEGIAHALPLIEVSISPGQEARLISIAGDTQAASLWSLYALTPAQAFVGALAVKAHGLKLVCRSWPCVSSNA